MLGLLHQENALTFPNLSIASKHEVSTGLENYGSQFNLKPLFILIHDPTETFLSVLQRKLTTDEKKRFRNRTESLRIEERIILLNEFIALAEHILREVQSDHN